MISRAVLILRSFEEHYLGPKIYFCAFSCPDNLCTCAYVTILSYLQSLFRPNTHSGLLYKHTPYLDLHINCKVQQKFEWSVSDFCLYASLIFYFQGPDGLLMFVTVQSGVTNFHI